MNRSRKDRNQISDEIEVHPFTDYWDVFVLKHQHPWNIACHLLGIFVFYGLLSIAWFTQNPWLLGLLPLVQLVGLAGHYWFERSHIDLQDGIFSWRASFCLGKLLLRVLIGKYQNDIDRNRKILAQYNFENLALKENG